MARRIQFRLRSIFYATAIVAVLCLILPPLFRVAQRHFAAKRPLPVPVYVEIVWDQVSVDVVTQASIDAQPDLSVPSDAAFIKSTITSVNGKRVDSGDDEQDEERNTQTPE